MKYYLGTSGWSYPGWRGLFYPEEITQKDWLPFYSQNFKTVEINMTFYRFPKPETLRDWSQKTPPDFRFTLKANRQITHRKRLKNVKSDVRYFYILANNLKEKLGCILFQLPPSLTLDLDLLENFLQTLSSEFKNVVEFRNPSWYTEKVYEIMRRNNAVFCIVSSTKVPDTPITTSETAYIRFHGLTGGFRYNYTGEELAKWAATIKGLPAQECTIYFNNDYKAQAVLNCKTLAELLSA